MSSREEHLRRLSRFAAIAMIVEAAMYSAAAPLLAHYRREFELSTPAAGILTASYTAGMIAGSIGGAALANRFGPRLTVVAGFVVFAISSVIFGLAGSAAVLDIARAAQGSAAGLIWSGVLSWLIAAAPDDRRGQVIGTALGAAIFGTLFGPVVGTVAVAIGTGPTFAAVAVCSIGMVGWALGIPRPEHDPDLTSDWHRASRSRMLIGVTALSLFPGLVLGAMNTLVPLRLDARGLGALAVGATFLLAALVAAGVAPVVGRRSDRDGRVPIMVLSLAATGPALIALGLVNGPWMIAVLTVLTFGLAVSVFSVPVMALLSEVAEGAGLTAGPAAALINLTFAGGETIGAPLSAVGADLTTDGVPFLVLGVLALCAMVIVAQRLRGPEAYAASAD